jgi:O-antigen ligase
MNIVGIKLRNSIINLFSYNILKNLLIYIKHLTISDFFYASVAFVLATIPLDFGVNSVAILLMTFVWALSLVRSKIDYRQFRLIRYYYVILIIFGLLYILSFLWSIDVSTTINAISVKFPILIFPIIFFLAPSPTKKTVSNIFKLFIVVLIMVDLYCFFKSYQHFLLYHDIEVFFYHKLSNNADLNAIYLSAFNVIALLVIFTGKVILRFAAKALWSLIPLAVLFLLFSKMVVISFVVVLIIIKLLFTQKYRKLFVLGFLALITLSFVLGFSSKIIRNRVNEVFQAEINKAFNSNNLNDLKVDGISIRVFQYRALLELIREDPNRILLGYGLKAHKQKLNEKYFKYNIFTGTKDAKGIYGLDFHNQYLCSFLAIGLLGTLLLIYFIIRILFLALRTKDVTLFSVILFFALAFLTEMYLESQRGVVLFLTVLLLLLKRNEHIQKNIINQTISLK